MQTPTRMDKVVIDVYYHLTIMDENMNWMELTIYCQFFLSPQDPLLYIYLYFTLGI